MKMPKKNQKHKTAYIEKKVIDKKGLALFLVGLLFIFVGIMASIEIEELRKYQEEKEDLGFDTDSMILPSVVIGMLGLVMVLFGIMYLNELDIKHKEVKIIEK